jgi:hypothetical protein
MPDLVRKVTALPGGEQNPALDPGTALARFPISPPWPWLTGLILAFAAFVTFGVGVFIHGLAAGRLPGAEAIAWISLVMLSLVGLVCWAVGRRRLIVFRRRKNYVLLLQPDHLVERLGQRAAIIPRHQLRYAFERLGSKGAPHGPTVVFEDDLGREAWHTLYDRFTQSRIVATINRIYGLTTPPPD